VNLPAPVPLDPPPGDPSALADLVSAVTGAAFGAGVLGAHLAGPAATAPGWLSADAAAAAEQVGTVTALVHQLHDALTAAEQRLRAHAEVLDEARARIAALRRDQAEDFAVASTLVRQSDPELARPTIEELEAAEADRRRAHAAAVTEVLDDAAATAQVLDGSTVYLGGTGAPGEDASVLAHVATLLPGWGDGELVAEATAAAGAIARDSPEEFAAWLRSAGPLLDAPVFATAFLDALGGVGIGLVLYWTAVDDGSALAGPMARVIRAAGTSETGRRAVSRLLDSALDPPEAGSTVALGRLALAGAFPAVTLRSIAVRLVQIEGAQPLMRRDQLAVAPADDPLESVLQALAASGDADQAALLAGTAELWPTLLGRIWSEGLDGLTDVLRLAGGGESGDAATLVVLEGIARTRGVLLTQVTTGSPEAFTVASISAAVADLVARRPEAVSGLVLAGLSAPGVPSRPLEDAEVLAVRGLGLVGLDPDARVRLLTWLTDATAAAPFAAPGEPDPAAYLEGGIFAALASGEAFDNEHRLVTALRHQEMQQQLWDIVMTPLNFLPTRMVASLVIDTATNAAEDLFGPDGVPWTSFLGQPETGADQAAYAALMARVAPMVAAGALPDPGHALDRGPGSPEALEYEASLAPEQRVPWNSVFFGAEDGFQDVGRQLGVVAGS
jgi:hypothetical protein